MKELVFNREEFLEFFYPENELEVMSKEEDNDVIHRFLGSDFLEESGIHKSIGVFSVSFSINLAFQGEDAIRFIYSNLKGKGLIYKGNHMSFKRGVMTGSLMSFDGISNFSCYNLKMVCFHLWEAMKNPTYFGLSFSNNI